MRIIFLGTPQIAVDTFNAVCQKNQIVAVVTQPDKPHGRSKTLLPSPIALAAEQKNIPIYKSDKTDAPLIEELKKYDADIFLVFAYGVILKKDFFNITKFGGINIHPSLLPKLRGPSPIQTAILQGETKSGITVQTIKLKVDSGDILYQNEFEILPEEDYNSIEKKIATLSAFFINEVLYKFENNQIKPIPQKDNDATFCKLYNKEDGLIDWNFCGKDVINKIRAFVEWPTSYSFIDGKKVSIFSAKINDKLNFSDFTDIENGKIVFADLKNGIVVKTKDCLINLLMLQQEGKKVLAYKDFLNGFRDLNTKKFSDLVLENKK
ncbi:MAG: methionyl-tRNA formyltransferase [Spirochaetes bacterium GWD1_27_9]|nr:MAG: methionyl-tRNA formyltransferase [Spirochaetes bacterium GWB1_27_13]OHD27260.1 MAG: methionyl-tRNA formyltransferase [Spirochaetes bacterium GWC1_27_15]OHD31381.1 MAG: methionyl-tRNA formyltransferase [Spirochaetes bacterium GWD1_27_9]